MEIIASEFKAKCLHIMDEVARTGEPVVITKHGKPIAQLIPVKTVLADLFDIYKDIMVIQGDIIQPINVEWNAEGEGKDTMYE